MLLGSMAIDTPKTPTATEVCRAPGTGSTAAGIEQRGHTPVCMPITVPGSSPSCCTCGPASCSCTSWGGSHALGSLPPTWEIWVVSLGLLEASSHLDSGSQDLPLASDQALGFQNLLGCCRSFFAGGDAGPGKAAALWPWRPDSKYFVSPALLPLWTFSHLISMPGSL